MKRLLAQDLHLPNPVINMHPNILKLFFILLSLMVANLANATNSSISLIEAIKSDFIQIASSDISDYRLCELYSRHENKKDFVEKTLQKDFTKNMKGIHWKEMQFREENAKSSLHLGVIVIQYESEKDAINVASKVQEINTNYLANSKILTRYIALRDNDKVAFIYSETFIDDKIKLLLEKIEKKQRD